MKPLLISLTLALSACTAQAWPSPRIAYTHANSFQELSGAVQKWTGEARGNRWGRANPTGSMRPYIVGAPYSQIAKNYLDRDDREILLWQEVIDCPLEAGMVVRVEREGDSPLVHMIVEVRGDSLYLTGTNNRHSDGWHHKSKVTAILRGVVTRK